MDENTIQEIKAAIEQIRSGKTGWVEFKKGWFRDDDQRFEFMMAKGKKGIPILENRLAEIEAAQKGTPND